jgi:hypothetical protein
MQGQRRSLSWITLTFHLLQVSGIWWVLLSPLQPVDKTAVTRKKVGRITPYLKNQIQVRGFYESEPLGSRQDFMTRCGMLCDGLGYTRPSRDVARPV